MNRVGLIVAVAAVVAAAYVFVEYDDGSEAENPQATEPAAGFAGQPSAAPAEAAVVAQGQDGGALATYAIDAEQSEIYWRIYRAGAAARFGHNHVISIGELEGSVTVGDDVSAATWELSFPVTGLIIDDPAIRALYGEDFESVPSEDDKAGTKTNMLTDRVLNGEVYPQIALRGTGVNGSLDDAELPVTIEMLGRSIAQSFPAQISIDADFVTVSGEYRLTHADLGLEPFTAFGGLMAVGDDIDFTYRIHAVAVGR